VITDYYARDVSGNTLKLCATPGAQAIDMTSNGTGQFFFGEIPPTTIIGMKLLLTDLYENRGNTEMISKTASHFFAMDSARLP